MAKSFAELRASQGNALDELKEKFDKAKKASSKDPILDDDTFWTPKHIRGPDGTGYAKLRFLPAPPDGKGGMEDDPFIRYYEYVFKGPTGKWYNNLSPTSISGNNADPAYEYNGKIFGDETLTKEQKKKKLLQRNVHYVCGVYIVDDPNAPENNGKVFRYRYGPQIFKMQEAEMFPDQNLFPDKEPVQIFDPFDGATFTLRAYTKEIPDSRTGKMVKVPSYEKSSFGNPGPLFDDMSKFEEIWKQQYSLKELIAPEKFKSYDTLLAEFVSAMGHRPDGEPNFLDSDEPVKPVTQSSTKKANEPSQNLSSNEEEDEIPWDRLEEDSSKEEVSDTTFSDGDDDWFKDLKG